MEDCSSSRFLVFVFDGGACLMRAGGGEKSAGRDKKKTPFPPPDRFFLLSLSTVFFVSAKKGEGGKNEDAYARAQEAEAVLWRQGGIIYD